MTTPATERVFAAPYQYWVGIDTAPGASEDDLAELDDFYRRFHFPEVFAANPGFITATRYRLDAPDPRGDFGPMWLAVYGIEDRAGAERYEALESDPTVERPKYTPGPAVWKGMSPRWRIMWRQTFASGERSLSPESIFMVGMDTPATASAQEVAEFNDFYSSTHVPEVLSTGGYEAGTRVERQAVFFHREPDECPQFCAIYEGAGGTSSGPPPGEPTPGPDAWENRETRWRLRYRRVGASMTVLDAAAAR